MRVLPLITVALLTASSLSATQSVVPSAFPSSRYDVIVDQSPFALKTVVAAPEPPKDSFTKEWVLTGISKLRDEQGIEKDFVSIMNRNQTDRFTLLGTEENKDGISISSIERSPQTGKSKVTLKKGNEFGTVEFDQMSIENSQQQPGVPGQPGNPGHASVPHRLPNTPGAPGMHPVRQQISGRPAIPRPNLPGQQINNGAAPYPAQSTPEGGGRRRIRVINSKP